MRMLLCGTSSHRVDGVIEGSEGVAMIEVGNGDDPGARADSADGAGLAQGHRSR
ncbi:hypothetical protein ACIODS_28400 [Micromonospora chalcea]|uniref:hypothetical protein n=1 Tax=Micromonospora TaxID=1873 RepID=UPI001313E8E1|nr:hypothetical protein [Micromonospora sp. LHW51205]